VEIGSSSATDWVNGEKNVGLHTNVRFIERTREEV